MVQVEGIAHPGTAHDFFVNNVDHIESNVIERGHEESEVRRANSLGSLVVMVAIPWKLQAFALFEFS